MFMNQYRNLTSTALLLWSASMSYTSTSHAVKPVPAPPSFILVDDNGAARRLGSAYTAPYYKNGHNMTQDVDLDHNQILTASNQPGDAPPIIYTNRRSTPAALNYCKITHDTTHNKDLQDIRCEIANHEVVNVPLGNLTFANHTDQNVAMQANESVAEVSMLILLRQANVDNHLTTLQGITHFSKLKNYEYRYHCKVTEAMRNSALKPRNNEIRPAKVDYRALLRACGTHTIATHHYGVYYCNTKRMIFQSNGARLRFTQSLNAEPANNHHTLWDTLSGSFRWFSTKRSQADYTEYKQSQTTFNPRFLEFLKQQGHRGLVRNFQQKEQAMRVATTDNISRAAHELHEALQQLNYAISLIDYTEAQYAELLEVVAVSPTSHAAACAVGCALANSAINMGDFTRAVQQAWNKLTENFGFVENKTMKKENLFK